MNKNAYVFPKIELLSEAYDNVSIDSHKDNYEKIKEFFVNNDIQVEVTDEFIGPLVTEYAITIEEGTRVRKILSLQDDLRAYLGYQYLNIEFPILDAPKLGINVPSDERYIMPLRKLLEENRYFGQSKKSAVFLIGRNMQNQPIMGDLGGWPHMLIGGTTGSGKSCFVDSIITSMIYKYSPDELQFIMIDSKGSRYTIYDELPHMAMPTIVDTHLTFQIFGWLKKKMRKRYEEFSKYRVRTIQSYNEKMEEKGEKKLPSIVMVIDDITHFYTRAPKKTREDMLEIISLARAAGIYLIVVAQNASVDAIDGVVKMGFSGRFAFRVNSFSESRSIIDTGGAEKLLGSGECYFDYPGRYNLGHAQTAYVSEEDIKKVVEYVSRENQGKFKSEVDINEVLNEVTGVLF